MATNAFSQCFQSLEWNPDFVILRSYPVFFPQRDWELFFPVPGAVLTCAALQDSGRKNAGLNTPKRFSRKWGRRWHIGVRTIPDSAMTIQPAWDWPSAGSPSLIYRRQVTSPWTLLPGATRSFSMERFTTSRRSEKSWVQAATGEGIPIPR